MNINKKLLHQQSVAFPVTVIKRTRKFLAYAALSLSMCSVASVWASAPMDDDEIEKPSSSSSYSSYDDEIASFELIELDNDEIKGSIVPLLASPEYADWKYLKFQPRGINGEDLRHFNNPDRTCKVLNVSDNKIGLAGATYISIFPFSLKELYLDRAFIDAGSLQTLFGNNRSGTGNMRELRKLSLAGNKIDNEGATIIANSPHLSNLTYLNLTNNIIGAQGIEQIVSSKPLSPLLRELYLDKNPIDNEAARGFAAWTLTNIRTLGLSSPKSVSLFNKKGITGEGLLPLVTIPPSSKFEKLNLAGHQVGHVGAEYIAKSRSFPNIKSLDLSHNNIGNKGLISLVMPQQLPQFQSLISLNLLDNNITSSGIEVIKQAVDRRHLPQLNYLNLSQNSSRSELAEWKKSAAEKGIIVEIEKK